MESRSCLSRCALSGRVLLWHLFQRTSPLAIDTIREYRSASSSTLYNVVDLTNPVFLRNLLKNMDLQCPRYKELCPIVMIASISLTPSYQTGPRPAASSSSSVHRRPNMGCRRRYQRDHECKWNLALVLAYISSPPFEPIMKD